MTNHYINASDSRWLKSIYSWKTLPKNMIDWNSWEIYDDESREILSELADRAKNILTIEDHVNNFNQKFK